MDRVAARASEPDVLASSGSALVQALAQIPGWAEKNFQVGACCVGTGATWVSCTLRGVSRRMFQRLHTEHTSRCVWTMALTRAVYVLLRTIMPRVCLAVRVLV
jgi:hypothetical protein